jgi:signal transduction histidine kinase
VTVQRSLHGYLYIVLAGDEYATVTRMLGGSYIQRLGLGVSLGIVLFAVVVGLVLFHQLTRRLRGLTATVEDFRTTRLTGPEEDAGKVEPSRGDELDRLAASFERMSERIDRQVEELQATDALRRELVANVSHDLRTPLASLQGYLETLLLKKDLPEESRRQYLETARHHAERLGKLVGDLFELAKLESSQVELQLEDCSLAELVQDVVQKYQLEAENKDVQLTCELRQDLPFVTADLGLIERVLENLLDNALRHTPSGGTVTIGLSGSGRDVSVQVADTGCGIASEDLPHVFDRYYRARRSDGGREGAGLGLAIARRIVELHGGTIEAHSRLDSGSSFLFVLPARS